LTKRRCGRDLDIRAGGDLAGLRKIGFVVVSAWRLLEDPEIVKTLW
jgi:hypothetical protein